MLDTKYCSKISETGMKYSATSREQLTEEMCDRPQESLLFSSVILEKCHEYTNTVYTLDLSQV